MSADRAPFSPVCFDPATKRPATGFFRRLTRHVPVLMIVGVAMTTGRSAAAQTFHLEPVDGSEFHFRNDDEPDQKKRLQEPSGLALDEARQILWTVDDENPYLYKLDLTGRIVDVIDLTPADQADGLEGVTVLNNGKLAIVREEPNRVLIANPETGAISADKPLADLDPNAVATTEFSKGNQKNKGFEGITFDPGNNRIYLIKEHDPRLLMTLPADMTAITTATKLRKSDGFDAPGVKNKKTDVSGLAFDISRGLLWILSAEGKVVFAYDPASGQASAVPLTWKGKPVKRAEGIAVTQSGEFMYIVTDDFTDEKPDSRFLKYRITNP